MRNLLLISLSNPVSPLELSMSLRQTDGGQWGKQGPYVYNPILFKNRKYLLNGVSQRGKHEKFVWHGVGSLLPVI